MNWNRAMNWNSMSNLWMLHHLSYCCYNLLWKSTSPSLHGFVLCDWLINIISWAFLTHQNEGAQSYRLMVATSVASNDECLWFFSVMLLSRSSSSSSSSGRSSSSPTQESQSYEALVLNRASSRKRGSTRAVGGDLRFKRPTVAPAGSSSWCVSSACCND